MSLDVYLEIPEHVLSRDLEGESVLLNLETGCYYSLDLVGSHVWALVQAGKSLRAIKGILEAEYRVGDADVEADLVTLVADLKEQGLLQEVDGQPESTSDAE